MTGNVASFRVVLITGAAGGLGQELVRQFKTVGWRVAAGIHRNPGLPSGDALITVPLDVTDRESVSAAIASVLDQWGRLDALINNAGLTADALSWQLSDEEWDRALDVNLKGAFLCAQAAVRPMLRQRDGHIINVGSFSGRAGQRGQANYAAAKAGLIGLTESLAREVGSRNIRVNAILPGVLPTPMTAKLSGEQLAGFASANALGRLNSVAEVAQFVVFLAALQNVSGQVFQLDSRIGRWT
jgi:3-oxoacyl-[acyl-carrier protein] reductase